MRKIFKNLSMDEVNINIVKLRSRSGEGQVRVRKVRARSESCELKDFNIKSRTWT